MLPSKILNLSDFSIRVPASWMELSRSEVKWLLRNLTSYRGSLPMLKAHALMRFSGLRSINGFSPEELALLLQRLDWIDQPLQYPWRPSRIAGRIPVEASLKNLPFGKFLALDNLYAGMISRMAASQNRSSFRDKSVRKIAGAVADILIGRPRLPISPGNIHAFILWIQAAKSALQKQFPELYVEPHDDGSLAPDNSEISPKKLYDSMNAQIRALTKGDITKEEKILELPTERALVELNALAREYNDLKKRK